MLLGGSVAVVCLLPLFLTGAMATQLTRELSFGSVGLGLAVAVFRGAGALSSLHLGRLVDRLGASRSIRLAAVVAAVSSLGIATTATQLPTLLAWLAVCGCAIALAQPAANRLLINSVDGSRLGAAFGVKQSAPPAASMIAGLSVPILAVTLGWRWAYVVAASLAVVVAVSVGRSPAQAPKSERVRRASGKLEHPRLIVLLAVAFGLGDSTSSVATSFYVDSAVQAGTTPEFAGTILAVASVGAIAVRLSCGLASDWLRTGHLSLCAGLLALGAVGLSLLATDEPGWMAVGAVIAFAGGWGFNGIFWFAMVRAYSATPGRITGTLSPGGLIGSSLGPVLFGTVAERFSYPLAWLLFTGIALVAALTMWFGGQRLRALRP